MRQHKLWLCALLVLLLAALGAPWLSPQNPYDLTQLNILDGRLRAALDAHLASHGPLRITTDSGAFVAT